MDRRLIVETLDYCEPAACAMALLVMLRTRQFIPFRSVAAFLATRLAGSILGWILLWASDHGVVPGAFAYTCYFYVYWLAYAIEAVLGLTMVYDIYKLAMAPLQGLQKLGMLMFRWAGGIACAVAAGLSFGPHVTGSNFIVKAVAQLQQTQSILTLCLLLFVCLAIRPMGLSQRSRIFGVSLGLGILATTDLVLGPWIFQQQSMFSLQSIVGSLAFLVGVSIWIYYFLMPEPERRMIVLPTTSPFLRWNQISLVLGDEPGYVAVGDVTLDLFAPAEVEIMRRASAKMGGATTQASLKQVQTIPKVSPLLVSKTTPSVRMGAIPKVKFIAVDPASKPQRPATGKLSPVTAMPTAL